MIENDMIKKPIGIRILRGLLIGFGLLLFNLIFILGPFVAVWGMIVAFIATGFAFILTGLTLITGYFITIPFDITVPSIFIGHPVLMLFGGGTFIGLGGLFISIFLWLGKYLGIGTVKYSLWHVKIIRGEEHE